MIKPSIRVRFAPAPTGMMHLGNVRTALMNYLFAQQKDGTFIIRIEDTDSARNYDPEATNILADLAWLGIDFDEGPQKGGPHIPYFQSQRTIFYQKRLQELIARDQVYRCFCSSEELDKKRERQQALKLPPRYDRTCLSLEKEVRDKRSEMGEPSIWRLKLNHEDIVSFTDLARGTLTFEVKNFSDFPLTRQDGSVTFMFANFVDDMDMEITHIFRGEDHLSNTAGQACLYKAFNAPLPIFWHMPILCNIDGRKLSKRDFGFSLRDLKDAGFTPEAIDNYLAIIGGSFDPEIMNTQTIAKVFNFDNVHTTGQIKYDVEKLKWINKQWICLYEPEVLAERCLPFIEAAYGTITIGKSELIAALQIVKTEMITLSDVVPLLKFLLSPIHVTAIEIQACIEKEYLTAIKSVVESSMHALENAEKYAQIIKKAAQEKEIPLKQLFWFLRLSLMNNTKGPGIHELVAILGAPEARHRLEKTLNLLATIS